MSPHFPAGPAAAGSPLTGFITMDSIVYSNSITCVTSGAGVLITSTASSDTGNAQASVHLTATVAVAAAVAAGGGTFSTTSQLTVTGNLAVSGTLTQSGTCSINGNVIATGTIPGGVSATGTKTSYDASVSVPSVTNIYNSLLPGAFHISSGNVVNLDFNTHPVIVVDGNATLEMTGATIIGNGTLVVNGNVTTGQDMGASGSPISFNLVCTGTFTATDKWYVNGSLYSAGLIKFNNQTVLTGVLVGNAGATLNNHHTFDFSTPPSFDPRSGNVTVSSYGDAAP